MLFVPEIGTNAKAAWVCGASVSVVFIVCMKTLKYAWCNHLFAAVCLHHTKATVTKNIKAATTTEWGYLQSLFCFLIGWNSPPPTHPHPPTPPPRGRNNTVIMASDTWFVVIALSGYVGRGTIGHNEHFSRAFLLSIPPSSIKYWGWTGSERNWPVQTWFCPKGSWAQNQNFKLRILLQMSTWLYNDFFFFFFLSFVSDSNWN